MAEAFPCLIWNTPATTEPVVGDLVVLNSPRAGGKYTVPGSVQMELEALSSPQRSRLTTWLCEQRLAGTPIPRITSSAIAEAKARRPLPVSSRVNNFLRYLDREALKVGERYHLSTRPGDEKSETLCAYTESDTPHDAQMLAKLMLEQGYLKDAAESGNTLSFALSPYGFSSIEKLAEVPIISAQGFVAMWFDPSMQTAYDDGFRRAIFNSGYEPMRIDKKEHINKIDDEIIAEIRRSRFLVADFTSEPNVVRGGVYYEAGFAMGLGMPVIWTCRVDAISSLHFDTRQYNHIAWKDPADLYSLLKARIGAVLGDGPQVKLRPQI